MKEKERERERKVQVAPIHSLIALVPLSHSLQSIQQSLNVRSPLEYITLTFFYEKNRKETKQNINKITMADTFKQRLQNYFELFVCVVITFGLYTFYVTLSL